MSDRATRTVWAIAALFLILALLPLLAQFGAQAFILGLVTRAMIFAIAALSLDLILGYGALVSFGHAAFLGIGAYAVGILSSHGVEGFFVQALVAVSAAALFALLTSIISLRTSGVYYIMSTLAFGQMLFFFAVSLSAYGGDDGITLSNRSTMFGEKWLRNDIAFYYLTFVILALIYYAARRVAASRFGRVITGIRENPQRMRAIGFSPFPYQLVACVLAGMVCAVAGVLLANQAEFVSPAYMSWQRSGELLIMVVLGGVGTLHGAILGALAFLLLEEWLSGLTEHWKLIFGPLLIIIVLLGKGGITGLIQRMAGGRHG
ncbi:MAG: branched-chain amino acid ABC transporter permease [Beijerinckiaceae bacterium]